MLLSASVDEDATNLKQICDNKVMLIRDKELGTWHSSTAWQARTSFPSVSINPT